MFKLYENIYQILSKKYWFKELPQKRYQDVLLQHDFEFSKRAKDWLLYIPHYGSTMNEELTSVVNADNRFVMGVYGSGALTRRKGVWVNLVRKFGRKKAKQIMPDTYVLSFEQDIKKLSEFPKNQSFILKSQLHRRQGLKIVTGFDELNMFKEDYVIAQPLILDLYQFKQVSFNIRVYLLLTLNKGALQGHLFYDGNCIYAIPKTEEEDIYKNRVTNGVNEVPDGFPFLMSELLEIEKIDYQQFFSNLAIKVNSLLQSAAPHFGAISNLNEAYCFQVLGVDVLVDANKKPLICEINKGPGMKARNKASNDLKNEMLKDALSIVGLTQEKNEGFFKVFEENL